MSQPSIASYFNTRKRPATEELSYTHSKVFLAESIDTAGDNITSNIKTNQKNDECRIIFNGKIDTNLTLNVRKIENIDETISASVKSSPKRSLLSALQPSTLKKTTRLTNRANTKRTETSTITSSKITKGKNTKNETPKLKQQNLVKFIKQGNLSPLNKLSPQKDVTIPAFIPKNNAANVEKGLKSQQNESKTHSSLNKEELNNLVRKELNFDEVKSKVTRSAKLQELKASINRLKELEKVRKTQEERSKSLKNGESNGNDKQANLKKFETIELEVLTSPQKGFKTPTKPVSTSVDVDNKNELMLPKKTQTPQRVLFSPVKDGSPSSKINQIPAYQRFQNLSEAGKPTLQLPYKYRYLIEMFRCIDSVCAMFYNRKEMITFKKLKPAVQRMARKNFNVSHLAQIKNLYPDAYQFSQMKTRNFGSTSKQDYFQLIITPIINGNTAINNESCCKQMGKIDDNELKSAQRNAMNPQVMIERLQKFTNILLNIVKDEHDRFLKSLDPPMIIPKDKITRWHPEFELEKCPDIEEAALPQPPNIEKFSSAKDILSTARNLFNCATPMERALARLEEKQKQQQQINNNDGGFLSKTSTETQTTPAYTIETPTTLTASNPDTVSLLKGIPKSLLEKVRAKQAAKMLDSMTRRQSEDREAAKYSRLPELARHLRNVFITEKKGVLPLDIVLKKIENSYRTTLTQDNIETHLKLIEKELPKWISFHEIRKTMYLKLNRDMELSKITETLTNIANEKFE